MLQIQTLCNQDCRGYKSVTASCDSHFNAQHFASLQTDLSQWKYSHDKKRLLYKAHKKIIICFYILRWLCQEYIQCVPSLNLSAVAALLIKFNILQIRGCQTRGKEHQFNFTFLEKLMKFVLFS